MGVRCGDEDVVGANTWALGDEFAGAGDKMGTNADEVADDEGKAGGPVIEDDGTSMERVVHAKGVVEPAAVAVERCAGRWGDVDGGYAGPQGHATATCRSGTL